MPDYPVGRCVDEHCLCPEPHKHGFECDEECACEGVGAETAPLDPEVDLETCDWGGCNRPSVALRKDYDPPAWVAESWLAVCSWHAGWDWDEEASK